MIAALYVESGGPYANLTGVDVWDEARDAREYRGPHSVVAHPPCKRWGRYWGGGPSAKVPQMKGDDGGCFAHALWAVRTFGGVLEHPADSAAWLWFGLGRPPRAGSWVRADGFGGWTCRVSQGHYGHKADKGTWLYAVGCELPRLTWGPCAGRLRVDAGFSSSAARAEARAKGVPPVKLISARDRLHTPEPFRDLLLTMARSPMQPAAFRLALR